MKLYSAHGALTSVAPFDYDKWNWSKNTARASTSTVRNCAFPEPAQLAAVPDAALHEIVRNDRKVTYLRAVTGAFLKTNDEFLYHAPTKELRDWLLNIKGIGEWSADFVLLRGLGRMEGMRMSEYSIRGDPFGKAIAGVYNDGKPLSNADRERLGDHYQNYRGYWAYYLRTNA